MTRQVCEDARAFINSYRGKLGAVDEGVLADLLLVDATPLENITLVVVCPLEGSHPCCMALSLVKDYEMPDKTRLSQTLQRVEVLTAANQTGRLGDPVDKCFGKNFSTVRFPALSRRSGSLSKIGGVTSLCYWKRC